MTRLSLTTLFVFLSITHLVGQKAEFLFSTGMGFYSMGDLKALNQELQQQIPFETRIVTDFPPYFQFGGQVAFKVYPIYRIGLKYMFSTTGSRISSADYSGEYYFDNVINGHTIGLINSFRLYTFKTIELDFQVNLGVIFSTIKMEEFLNVFDTTVSGNSRFTSTGFFAEPVLQATYQWNVLKMGVFMGYLLNRGGKITTSDGAKTSSYADWSGFRFGIVFGLTTGKSAQSLPVNSEHE